jgi:tetratricopeptide (TPR) repeat protein
MMINSKKYLALIAVSLLWNCASGKKDNSDNDRPRASRSSNANNAEPEERRSSSSTSGNNRFVTTSLSNNSLTFHTIDRVKAEEMIAQLQSSSKTARDKRELEALIAAQWLGGQPPEELIGTARKLVEQEMKQNVERDISVEAKLNIGLAALRARKYSMAEYFFERVRESKSARHKAAATTAIGIIAMMEGRIPEAVAFWNQALKEFPDFEPAKFNIGFTTLRFGDYKTAGRMLGSIENNVYAQVGMISVNRLAQNADGAEKVCDRVLKEKPNHKPALFNCALVAYQLKQDHAKAKTMLTRMVKIQSSDTKYDEEAYKLVTAIENDEQQGRRQLKNKDDAKPSANSDKESEK